MTDRHLRDLDNREDVAVERLLDLLPMVLPVWYQSLEIDPNSHWALVRPILKTPMMRRRESEIDVIFGRMVTIVGEVGACTVVWPPPTDYLVAVEAKCPLVTWEDTEPWTNATDPKSNLRQQLERDLAIGFHRVAALHVISTAPSDDYWEVLRAAHALGKHHLPLAERQLLGRGDSLPVGHAVLAIAGVSWKHEGLSGTVAPIKITAAPLVGRGPIETVRLQIESHLAACPKPVRARPIFVREHGGWRAL